MKRNFLIGLLTCSHFAVLAQWNTNGTHIYNSNTGNVGIGTIGPDEKLEISGNVKAWNAYMLSSNSLISRSGDHATGVNINSWLTTVGLTGAYSGWDLLYAQTGDGNRAIRVTNGSGTYFGELTGSGSEAPIYFGDGNHFIKSKYAEGVTIGTFGASTGIVLRESTGNVGIGTSSPSQRLHVSGGALVSSLAGSGNRMVIADASGVLSTQAIPTGDNLGNHTATSNLRLNGFWLSGDGGNEGLKIDGNGRVGINTSATLNYPFYVEGQSRLNGRVGILMNPDTDYALVVTGQAGKTVGGSTWASISDKRLKDVSGPIENALTMVDKLNPVLYTWNETRNELYGEDYPGVKYGFLAQEIREVIPEFVHEGSDGYLRYNPSGIEAILVAAIQEQSELLKKYEGKLLELQGAVESCCSTAQNHTVGASEIGVTKFRSTLHQNRPNPFNDRTVIGFNLMDEFRNASIVITDLSGMQKLFFGNLKAGAGTITVTHEQLYSGIFLYSLILDGEVVDTKRMVVAL